MSSKAEANGTQEEEQRKPPSSEGLCGEASRLFLVLSVEEPALTLSCGRVHARAREPQIAEARGSSGRKSRWAPPWPVSGPCFHVPPAVGRRSPCQVRA